MSRQRQTIELGVPRQQAISACREALDQLGWEITEEGERRLVGGEEPQPTSCRALTWPARVKIEVDSESSKLTTVTIHAAMSGFGRNTADRLQRRMGALERAIRGAAAGHRERARIAAAR